MGVMAFFYVDNFFLHFSKFFYKTPLFFTFLVKMTRHNFKRAFLSKIHKKYVCLSKHFIRQEIGGLLITKNQETVEHSLLI